jgi:plastocyanin
MTRRPLLLLVLALPAAALPACSGDEPEARMRDGRVIVAIDDFRYRPQLIRAAPGRIRFDRVNRGRLAHTFRLERGHVVAKVSSLLSGDRASKTARVRPGEYRFFCALSNHEALGMYGTLVVR